jgi:hypothetical protein
MIRIGTLSCRLSFALYPIDGPARLTRCRTLIDQVVIHREAALKAMIAIAIRGFMPWLLLRQIVCAGGGLGFDRPHPAPQETHQQKLQYDGEQCANDDDDRFSHDARLHHHVMIGSEGKSVFAALVQANARQIAAALPQCRRNARSTSTSTDQLLRL